MKESASQIGIIVKIVPTEAHNSIRNVESSRSVIWTTYNEIKIYLPKLRREERLSLAFRAINNVPSSDSGISPTMFVFGILPELSGAGSYGLMVKRGKIIRE